jgi:hypothetical protein
MAVEFGGYRFLSLEDFSPFVGGGVGMCWGTMPKASDSEYSWFTPETFNGLSLTGGGGMALFRTYDFHFLVSLKYNIVLAEGAPNGFLFSFGLTYKKSGGGGACMGI